jgi:hypothetical protein
MASAAGDLLVPISVIATKIRRRYPSHRVPLLIWKKQWNAMNQLYNIFGPAHMFSDG